MPITVEDPKYLEYKEKVAGTNINEQTLLATDYLNHFNEIIMILEMVPMMPEVFEDAEAWEPKSYKQHFIDSTVADKDLAVEAYDYVPDKYKQPFEEIVDRINRLINNALSKGRVLIDHGDTEKLTVLMTESSRAVQKLEDMAGAIIHGSEKTMFQQEIDMVLED